MADTVDFDSASMVDSLDYTEKNKSNDTIMDITVDTSNDRPITPINIPNDRPITPINIPNDRPINIINNITIDILTNKLIKIGIIFGIYVSIMFLLVCSDIS
jgi:hypothetical protein